ncbi:MAG: bifunctional phosphoglucose/phosphomannose isomerase [Saprospiraceae bacterium]|jgi:glucose/mannose-6-phosphate isomerase|nr:bifunctional phosphoglucose/phosphomannose isomerase [Saprospiraceae bacterium]MBK8109337.1 bifunctional phosphoglucose/phosphomannose isomerase [Saprospiraceae bacterium]MBL0084278.1 bifunctional phosphoglucose/phosphomannose isomerase [Saprospiraceae bacterium]MBP6397969.1 bifunctional phosphoglucose/phosphomannose isomerase [Saprospiraceae bacterium]
MMDQLIERFPAQLTEALEIGENATIKAHTQEINKVYVAGMGGSGIGANFVAEFIVGECKLPYIIGKGYDSPAFVDKNTLYIASSYSGNTEETLSALAQVADSGAKIVCISGGGKLIALAKERGYDYIQMPGDWPSPRACLGYSLVQQLYVLYKLNIIGRTTIDQIKSSIDLIKYDQDEIKNKAEKIAALIKGKIPVIYTSDRMEAVAVRFRQQINENSKFLAWHHVIPEMNHNELVGWKDVYDNIAVIYFRNKDDFRRNAVRMDINKEVISKYCDSIIEIYSKGQSLVEKSMYFVHLGDWVSWYLAELRGVDALEVNVIDHLKGELAKLG